MLTKLLTESLPPTVRKEELLALKKTCVGNNIAMMQMAKDPVECLDCTYRPASFPRVCQILP